jgi:hypothetical protein
MQRQRWAWTHKYAVPMFVTSLIAVALSGSGLVAVMVFASGDDGSGGNGSGGNGDAESEIDPCMVGTWRTVGHTETIPTINETVELVSGGADVVFHADGTGTNDYSDGMRLEGDNVIVEFSGMVSFEYEAANGTFRYLSQDSDATLTLTVAGLPIRQDVIYSQDPAQYSCDGNTLLFSQEEQAYQGEYERSGS